MRFPTTPNSLFSAQAKEDANAYPYIRSFTFYCNSKLRPREKCAVPKINVSYRYCFCLYFLFLLVIHYCGYFSITCLVLVIKYLWDYYETPIFKSSLIVVIFQMKINLQCFSPKVKHMSQTKRGPVSSPG